MTDFFSHLALRQVSEIFEPNEYDKIHTFYNKNGFVLIQLLDERACIDAIKEQVEKILLKQPWEAKLVVLDPITEDEIVYSPATSDAYVKALVQPNLKKKVLDGYKDAFPFHRGFGACCDPVGFHLHSMWRIRENPHIVRIAANLIGHRIKDLWVDINRPIHKLPTEGDAEFLHWDLQKFGEYQPDTSVQGKVMFSTGQFVCVPGTHTEEFHERFNHYYSSIYSENIGKAKAMTNLHPDKADPLGLKSQTCNFCIPAGCCIFWSTNLLHGQQITPRNAEIEFGMYLGYMLKTDRREYTAIAKRIKEKNIEIYGNKSVFYERPITELQDRIYSFEHGVAPFLWPSLQPIEFYPKKFNNFPHILAAYVARMTKEAQQKYLRIRQSGPNPDNMVYDLLPWKDEDYVPYKLSPLGLNLLI